MTRGIRDPDFIDELRRLKERISVLERTSTASGEGFPDYIPEGPALYVDKAGPNLFFFDSVSWQQVQLPDLGAG